MLMAISIIRRRASDRFGSSRNRSSNNCNARRGALDIGGLIGNQHRQFLQGFGGPRGAVDQGHDTNGSYPSPPCTSSCSLARRAALRNTVGVTLHLQVMQLVDAAAEDEAPHDKADG